MEPRLDPRSANLIALVAAAVAGLALLVAHPPVGWWWTTFVGPALLVVACQLRPTWSARLGALTGAVAFGPMLTWIILPAGYLAWFLLVATQMVFLALTAVAIQPWLTSRWLPIATAAMWTGVDAWRAVFPLGGFEWGAIAYAHVDGSFVLPVARVLGGRAITFLVVLISVAGIEVVRRGFVAVRDRGDASVDRALRSTNTSVALLVGGMLASILITIEPPPEVGTLDVLAVQGNDIRHWEEQVTDPRGRITTQLRDATVAAVRDGPRPDLVVWPEASVDTDPDSDRGAPFRPLIADAAAVGGHLLFGANPDGPDPATQFYRSQLLVDRDADPVDRYDKRAVVPFGEYIPLRRFLDWFPPLAQIPRDILPAPAAHAVALDGISIAVLICFETLFGDVARTNILAGDTPAALLVAATTDASFGDSAEPAQHLAQSRLRAVETGRWVVHAALSGSSAFVDPRGGTYQDTGLFEIATIRMDVPLVEGRTPFLVIGDVLGHVGRALAVLALLAVAWGRWRRRGREARAAQPAGAGVGEESGDGDATRGSAARGRAL